jgi:hypothetical protein
MNRRTFLTSVGAAAATVAVAPVALAEPQKEFRDATTTEMSPESKDRTLAVLLKTSSGRQKLAASLGPSIRRRLDIRREAKGLPKTTLLDENFPKDAEISDSFLAFDASLHIEELRLKRYHKLAAGLRTAMDDLMFMEARRYQFLKPTHEMLTLPSFIMSYDETGKCMVSFRLIQKYAMREV